MTYAFWAVCFDWTGVEELGVGLFFWGYDLLLSVVVVVDEGRDDIGGIT